MVLQYEQVHSLEDGHEKGITRVAFSLKGAWIATAGLDGRVCVWDSKLGTLKYVFAGTSAVLSLIWLPNGEELLMCGLEDGNIACLDIGGACIEANGFLAHYQPVECLAVKGEFLVSGACQEVTIWRWDDSTSKYVTYRQLEDPPTNAHNEWKEILVTSVEWVSPAGDQSLLVVSYMNHGIVLIDTTTWATVHTIGTNGQIAHAVVSDDGTRIAVSNMIRGFDIYSLRSGAPLCSLNHEIRSGNPTPVLWLHGGLALLGGTTAGQLTLWDVMNAKESRPADKLPAARVLYRLPLPDHAISLAIAAHYDEEKDDFMIAAGLMNFNEPSLCLVWRASEDPEPSKGPSNGLCSSLLWFSWVITTICVVALAFIVYATAEAEQPSIK